MGFHKISIIVLLVLLTYLTWPMSLMRYLETQQERDLVWRERVRVATEDALLVMRESSLGYGSREYHLNAYDSRLAIDAFFRSVTGDLEENDVGVRRSIHEQIPVIVVFDTYGYVINCALPSNFMSNTVSYLRTASSLSDQRVNLPRRYYLLKDDKAIYWLSHGDIVTAVSQSASIESVMDMAVGQGRGDKDFIQGNVEKLIERANQDIELGKRYPTLARVESVAELKQLFLEAAFEDIDRMLANGWGPVRLPEFFKSENLSALTSSELSGFCTFISTDVFGSKSSFLKPIASWGTVNESEDVIGLLEENRKIYCYASCKKHRHDEIISVFPDIKSAAQNGFLPCEAGILKQ